MLLSRCTRRLDSLVRTSSRHGSRMFPQLKRGDYKKLAESDASILESIVGSKGIKRDDLVRYNTDWLGSVSGNAEIVVSPRSVEEVSAVLAFCNEKKIAVVPQGGNTGLVGGSNPVFDELILSLERMSDITNIDHDAGVVECQAGAILQNIKDNVLQYGYTVPLDLGSRGSCTIGGNLATHAGGLRVVRYGRLRGSVLGMRVVLPDGKVLNSMTNMRKDNTGYDIKQLFIGAEGTLGVITDVSLLLPQEPASVNVAMFGCESFEHLIKCYRLARRSLGEIVSATEYMDSLSMRSVNNNLGLSNPLQGEYSCYFIVETSGMCEEHDKEKMEHYIELVTDQGLALDGVLASSRDQSAHMMSLRENCAVGLQPLGFQYKYDVTVPIADMYSLVEKVKARLSHIPSIQIGTYGHVAEGDIHIDPITPQFNQEVLDLLEPYIYEEVVSVGGSISAEHGMGLKKANFLKYSKDPTVIQTMRLLKDTFDPNHIMNPYKVLPWE